MTIARLRIPTGWTVAWNTLTEPLPGEEIPPFDDLTQDLLQLVNLHRHVLVDLGWRHDHQPDGHFLLKAIRRPAGGCTPEEWARPLRVLKVRSYFKMRRALEDWLEDLTLDASAEYANRKEVSAETAPVRRRRRRQKSTAKK